jgi:hypothetical protein
MLASKQSHSEELARAALESIEVSRALSPGGVHTIRQLQIVDVDTSLVGKHSFEAFTHKRPVVNQPSWIEGQIAVSFTPHTQQNAPDKKAQFRYPPYTSKSFNKFQKMQRIPAPNFNRNGKLLYGGFFWRIVLLGAATPKAGFMRYLFALLCQFFLPTSASSFATKNPPSSARVGWFWSVKEQPADGDTQAHTSSGRLEGSKARDTF